MAAKRALGTSSILLLIGACGDAQVSPEAMEWPCAIHADLQRDEVSVGSWFEVLLLPSFGAAAPELRLPAGWRQVVTSSRSVSVKAPYEPGTYELVASASCDGEVVEQSAKLRVVRPQWSEVAEWTDDGPPFMQLPYLWTDAAQGRLFMFGGYNPVNGFDPTIWSFTAAKGWTVEYEPEGFGANMQIADVTRSPAGSLILIDSFSGWSNVPGGFAMYEIDNGPEARRWSELAVDRAPLGASYGTAFIYAPKLGKYVSACGMAESGMHCEVGTYDPQSEQWAWPLVETDPDHRRPVGRFGSAFAYDPRGDRLVMFSGATGTGIGDDPVDPPDDTWALELGEDPMRWRRLFAGDEDPAPRRHPCFAHDTKRNRLVVWGGTPDARTVLPDLQILELDPGHERWVELELPFTPPPRSSCSGTYDSAEDRIIFGMGNTRERVFQDLVALHFLHGSPIR